MTVLSSYSNMHLEFWVRVKAIFRRSVPEIIIKKEDAVYILLFWVIYIVILQSILTPFISIPI
jgi:hypothetical protein